MARLDFVATEVTQLELHGGGHNTRTRPALPRSCSTLPCLSTLLPKKVEACELKMTRSWPVRSLLAACCLALLPSSTSLLSASSASLLSASSPHTAPDSHNVSLPPGVIGLVNGAKENSSLVGGVAFGDAIDSLWQKISPFIVQEVTPELPDRLATFRKRLVTEAEDLVSVYTHHANILLPEREEMAGNELMESFASDWQQSLRRTKRNHPIDLPLYKDHDGVLVLQGMKGETILPVNGSRDLCIVLWRGRLIVALIDIDLNLSIYSLDQQSLQATVVWTSPGIFKCRMAPASPTSLLLVCIPRDSLYQAGSFVPGPERGTAEVTVYLLREATQGNSNLLVTTLQSIPTHSPSDVHIWVQEERCYLMVADAMVMTVGDEGPQADGTSTYHTTSSIYHWTGQYFDLVHELPGTHPTSVLHFRAKTYNFIAMANFINNKGEHNCQSYIYRYSLDLQRYVHFQQLLTKGAKHFEAFTLGSGAFPHIYLAVANSCEDYDDSSMGRCNPYTNSKIYRFHFGKFVLFQEIPTAYAVQWLAVQVEDGVVLAVANTLSGVAFYQYNGWRFVHSSLQPNTGPFSAGVTAMAALAWNGSVVMGVTNQNSNYSSPHVATLYTLTFTRDSSLQEFHEKSESWCLERLSQLRQQDLNPLLLQLKAAPKVSHQNYTFTKPFTIVGNLSVQGTSSAHQVYIRGRDQWIPDPVSKLGPRRGQLQQELQRAQLRLQGTIPLHGPVTWPVNLHFSTFDARGTSNVSSVIDLLVSEVNNKVMVAKDNLLKLSGSTLIKLDKSHFSKVEVQGKAVVVNLLNRSMAEYVTLGGRHSISGRVTFLGSLGASQVTSRGTVDGVSITPDTILLDNTSQSHTGSVSCVALEAEALHVNTINNFNINRLFQSLVTRDAPATITGRLVVKGDLIHSGNLDVNATNIDLFNPLRTDDPRMQVVTGHRRVGGLRCQSARVTGRVNEVSVPEEVFLRGTHLSYSVSSAAFTHLLAASLTINTALHTITVRNGHLDVMLATGSQPLTARKTFASMHLKDDSSSFTYGRRLRRELGSRREACGFLAGRGLTEDEARREELLGALRRVSAVQDLLTYLNDNHPGGFSLPRDSISFYTRLAEEVPCAFSDLDNEGSLLTFDFSNLDWKNTGKQIDVEILDFEGLVDNIEKYKEDLDEDIANNEPTWHDLFEIFVSERLSMHVTGKDDLPVLESVILAFNNEVSNEPGQTEHEPCKMCPDMNESSSVSADSCLRGYLHIKNVLRRISKYSFIVSSLSQLSIKQREALQVALEEHGIWRLLQVIRGEQQLGDDLRVAGLCLTKAKTREDDAVMKMLASYRQELLKAAKTGASRTKRAAPATTEYSWSTGDYNCNTVPSRYYGNVTFAQETIVTLKTALQYLQNISATLPWNVKISANSKEAEFESYFRHHTEQVFNTVKLLHSDPLQAVTSLTSDRLSAQATYFIHLLAFANRFRPSLSLAARKDLDSLRTLLPLCSVKLTQVVTCLKLSSAIKSLPHVEKTKVSTRPSVDNLHTTFQTTRTSSFTASVHSTTKIPSSTWQRNHPITVPSTSPSAVSGSWVMGLVAGYDLESLARYSASNSLSTNDPVDYIVTRMARVKNLVFKDVLNVTLVNSVDVVSVGRHGLLLSANSIPFSITFSEPVTAGGEVVVTGLINMVAASHYATLKGRNVFTHPVTFTSGLKVNGNVRVEAMVNNIDLTSFIRNIALTTNSSVFKVFLYPITFSDVVALSLVCSEGSVAGVRLRDLVLLNDTAIISGKKRFLEVVSTGGLKVDGLNVDFVNGINVTALFLHSFRKNPGGVQVVTSAVQVKQLVLLQDLATRGFSTSSSNTIFDISRLPERVVYLDQNTTITGGLVLEGAILVSSLAFLGTLDNVSSARYETGWLLKNSDQVISGQMVLAQMTSGNVQTAPGVHVQEVDLARLYTTSLLTTVSTAVLVPVSFGEVRSLRWVSVTGRVQGWDLSQDAILPTTSNLVFTASLTFLGPVNITGSFLAMNGIIGVDLDALCGRLAIDTLNVYGTVRFAKNVSVDLAQFGNSVITGEAVDDFWLRDRDVILKEALMLEVLEVRHLKALMVNRLDVASLASNVLRQSCSRSQEVSGVFHIGDLGVDSLSVNTVKTNTLNGRPASDLLGVFTVGGGQVITGYWRLRNVHMAGNVVTSGLVNGMSMQQFCQLGKSCIVLARKSFTEDIIVTGNHNVMDRRRVQEVDVSESFNLVVYKDFCGNFPGLTTFTASLAVTSGDVKVQGLVAGIRVSSLHLLTLAGTQVMTGPLSLYPTQGTSLVSMSLSATDELFNGFNLTALLGRMFKLEGSNRVKQSVRFLGVVVFRDISYGPGALTLARQLHSALNTTRYQQSFFQMRALANVVNWAVKGRVREFWGWSLVQRFEAAPERLVPLRLSWGETAGSLASGYLALITKFGHTRLLGYNTASKQYFNFDVIPGNCTRSVVGYRRPDGDIFVVTGHACNFDDTTHNTTSQQVVGDEWVKVYRMSLAEQPYLVSSIPTPGAADVQVMWRGGVVCLVVVEARGTDTVIHCEYDAGHFRERQRIHAINPRKVSVAEHKDPLGRSWTFLTVADPGTFPDRRGASYIWRSDHHNGSFSILQEFDLHSAVWVEFASHRADLFLVVVLETFRGDEQGAVNIYRMDWFSEDGSTPLGHSGTVMHHDVSSGDQHAYPPRPSFHLVQVMPVVQPLEARFLVLPSQLLLYVINQQGFVTRFAQRGIHKFWEEGVLHAAKKTTLEVWSAYDNGTLVHRISVAGQACGLEDPPGEEPATILEELFRSKKY